MHIFPANSGQPMIPAAPSLVVLAITLAVSIQAAPVDYMREVKPLLTQHCSRCHGSSTAR